MAVKASSGLSHVLAWGRSEGHGTAASMRAHTRQPMLQSQIRGQNVFLLTVDLEDVTRPQLLGGVLPCTPSAAAPRAPLVAAMTRHTQAVISHETAQNSTKYLIEDSACDELYALRRQFDAA